MNRQQFDETFTGRDLTIQVRAALDFAQQNGLAFGRSMGDQYFVFSRLPAAPEPTRSQRPPQSNQGSHGQQGRRGHRGNRGPSNNGGPRSGQQSGRSRGGRHRR